jgi:hypothetical protein
MKVTFIRTSTGKKNIYIVKLSHNMPWRYMGGEEV